MYTSLTRCTFFLPEIHFPYQMYISLARCNLITLWTDVHFPYQMYISLSRCTRCTSPSLDAYMSHHMCISLTNITFPCQMYIPLSRSIPLSDVHSSTKKYTSYQKHISLTRCKFPWPDYIIYILCQMHLPITRCKFPLPNAHFPPQLYPWSAIEDSPYCTHQVTEISVIG